jgi:hypothetical protein
MIEHDDTQDHWKDLAEQLGLPPEGESAPAAKTEVSQVAKVEKPAKVVKEQERFEPEPVEEQAHQPLARETAKIVADEPDRFEKHEESSDKLDDEPIEVEDHSLVADEGEDQALEAPEQEENIDPEAEEPSRGRRRRGGRGGKGRQEGKGGRTRDPGTKTKAKAEPSEKKEAATAADEEGGDDIEDLSDLTVPSWQELIGSLYRPER